MFTLSGAMSILAPTSQLGIPDIASAAAIGAASGQFIVRTRLPSFIATLASLFILRWLTLVGLKWATGGSTQLRGIAKALGHCTLKTWFSGVAFGGMFDWLADHGFLEQFDIGLSKVSGEPISVVWFIAAAVLATWILLRTRAGNWVIASGGDANAARNCGVPFDRVKTPLIAVAACAAAPVAIISVLDAATAIVYQDPAMIPLMSIARNFFMGREPRKGIPPFRYIDFAHCHDVTSEEMHKIGIDIRGPN